MRQVVLAARELDPVAERLRAALSLGEPFADPGVGYFGLRNAVFALGDTFIEVVSPMQEGTAAGRLIEPPRRRLRLHGHVPARRSRSRAGRGPRAASVREVFEIELDDIAEVHLHPADMRGAIVSSSAPRPPGAWRWGGPDWEQRSVPGAVAAITVGVTDPAAVGNRWRGVVGELPHVDFVADDGDRGLVEVAIAGRPELEPFSLGGVRFTALR